MAQKERLICASSELIERGAGVRFTIRGFGQAEPAFLIRFQGKAKGFINRCAHVPTELDWNPGDFFDFDRQWIICATHGALYHPVTGACVGGRCNGKGLRPLPVAEHDGGIYLIEGINDE
jgi:nitrite reductase/ring-hydroxylating ferredoxin subunit